MDEAVLGAVLRRDEAETLVSVEPLDGSFHAHAMTPEVLMSCCSREFRTGMLADRNHDNVFA
jgi:hypothetical protein